MAIRRALSLAVLTWCVVGALSLKLPSYVKPCSRNDPDINACVLKNGRASIPNIVNTGGDRKYNIPNLNPLFVTELGVDQNGLKLIFKNLKLFGLGGAELTKVNIDFKSKREEYDLTIPHLEIIGDYQVSGRILVLPILGSGASNITISNLKIHVSHDYDLVKGKTGRDHMVTKNPTLVFEPTKGYIMLDNLFGNKELSDNMNVILNENSEEVIGDVGPAVAQAINLVVDKFYNGVTKVVSFDEFYPTTA